MPAELKEPGNQDHPDMKDSTSSPPAKSKTSQYELQRLENIRRNMEFLNSLGIEKTHFGDASAAKKKKKTQTFQTPQRVQTSRHATAPLYTAPWTAARTRLCGSAAARGALV